jgi:hypothetical protein
MKVLWIHHLQEMWDEGYRRLGTSYESLIYKTAEHIKKGDYDKIILTQFKNLEPEEMHSVLIDSAYEAGVDIDFIEYGYGWTKEDFSEEELTSGDLISGTRYFHTENDVIPIYEFQKKLVGSVVSLCGAFKGECLLDAQTVLKHFKIKYKTIQSLSC